MVNLYMDKEEIQYFKIMLFFISFNYAMAIDQNVNNLTGMM